MKSRLILIIAELLTASCCINAQGLPTDGKLTIRPMLQQLGEEQGKTGSIVAINPANGEKCCKFTNFALLLQHSLREKAYDRPDYCEASLPPSMSWA